MYYFSLLFFPNCEGQGHTLVCGADGLQEVSLERF